MQQGQVAVEPDDLAGDAAACSAPTASQPGDPSAKKSYKAIWAAVLGG